jgi:hypothetical protein
MQGIAVLGKDQEVICQLSEPTTDLECLTQKILNLTAEYSNNSSSKAGDATTPLLGRN